MRRRRESARARLAVGFLLLSWGGIMLITNVESARWPLETWWPAMIISLGVFFMITPGNKYGWAVVSLVSGGLALAANHGKITLDTVFVWWPSILVAIGLWIVFRAVVPEKSNVTGRRRATTILDRTADQFDTTISEPQMTGVHRSDRANADGGENNWFSARNQAGAPRHDLSHRPEPTAPVVRGHTPARRTATGQDIPQARPATPPIPSYQPASQYEQHDPPHAGRGAPDYTPVGRYLRYADPPMYSPPPGFHQPPGPPMGLTR